MTREKALIDIRAVCDAANNIITQNLQGGLLEGTNIMPAMTLAISKIENIIDQCEESHREI
jgi:hypothetical protein